MLKSSVGGTLSAQGSLARRLDQNYGRKFCRVRRSKAVCREEGSCSRIGKHWDKSQLGSVFKRRCKFKLGN